MSDDNYLDDFDDELHIPTTTSTQPLRQSLDLFTTLDLANVNQSQRQTYDAMLEHHMARVRIPIRHLTEQKPISRDISRDISTRERHDTDMSSIAGTRVLPSRPHVIDHKRIRSTVDNQLSHAVLAFLESAAKRKNQRRIHKSNRYAHVESRIHKTLSASPSVASISPTKQKRHMISPAQPQPQRQNLTSSETSTPLRTPHGMPPSPMLLSQPSQSSQTSHDRSQTSLSLATIERERAQRERARMDALEEENEKLKQKVATLEAENEKLKREIKERRKRDKVRALMAEAAEKEKEKEQQQQQQQEKQRTKSHKKSISTDTTPLQTSSQPTQQPPPMGRKSSTVSLHIPTATNPKPLASTPVITPTPVTVTITPTLAPTPAPAPAPAPAPVSATATTPTTQPTRTSPMKSSASTSSLKHKPTRSDQMRAEARRAAAEAATQKEQERAARDAERDKLIRARAKRQAKQKQQDTYGELLGHSTDNMDLLELSLSHEEKIRPGIPKLSMERAIALITPRDDDAEEEKEEEYVDEEFETYDEDDQDESNALNIMLQPPPHLTINTSAPTIATSSTRLTPSHISIPTIISPSHAQRCAVDGCRATRSTRGYCVVHAAMHSPISSPTKSTKTSQLHDDSLTLSSDLINDSTLEYDASHDGLTQIQSHKPPIDGLKLDFSNMDLQQNRHLWAIDNVSDSFEITKSGTFKRGDFTLNKRGLSVRSDDITRTTSISTPRLEEVGKTSPKKRASVAKNYLMQKEDLVILNVLGRGSSGVVYRCFDLPSLSLLALKCISITEQDKRRHITRELVTLASDQSPYLIGFKGAYFDEGHIYLALEYMNQGSLQDWIDTHGALSEWSLAYIFEKVLHGLHHLHQRQTVHRDIKPHNILINDDGQVKVADFGIMAQIKDPSIDQCNTFVGTLIYMSPERLGGAPYSYSCDIWSMGLAFLTCTLGKYAIPHTGHFELITKIQNAAKLVDDLPSKYSRDLKSFAAACLNSDPATRPTAQQLLSHPFLQRFREGSTTSREIPCPPEFISQRVDHDAPPSTQVSARRSSTIARTAPTPTMATTSTPSTTSASMVPPDTARRGSVTTQAVINAHMGDRLSQGGAAAALAREKYDNTAKVCEALVKRIQNMQKSPETPDRKRSPHATVTAEQIKQIALSLEVPQQLVHDIYTEKEKKSNSVLAS